MGRGNRVRYTKESVAYGYMLNLASWEIEKEEIVSSAREAYFAQQILIDGLELRVSVFDVVFRFPEDKTLRISSKLLEKHSKYFALMFSSGFEESNSSKEDGCKEVTIQDHSYEIYRATLVYLITAKINFDSNITSTLIYALAHQLELRSLQELALDHFTSVHLQPSNILSELFSERVDLYSELQVSAMSKVVEFWPILVKDSSFAALNQDLKEGELTKEAIDIFFECIAAVKKKSS